MKQLSYINIEQLFHAILWIDSTGRICQVNDAAADLTGYSREELLNSTAISDIDPNFPVGKLKNIFKKTNALPVYSYESIIKRKDKAIIPVEVTNNYIEFEGNGYSCSFFRDISERKKAEKALLLTEYSVNSSNIATFWIKPDQRFFYANAAACRNLGYHLEELLKIKISDIDPNWPEKYWNNEGWTILKKAGSSVFESIHRRKDGIKFPVEIQANYVKFEGNEYLFAFVKDITERKKADQELKNALSELEQLKNRLQEENIYLQEEIKIEHNFGELIGQSRCFKEVLRQVEKVASTHATVLILGETGTGKELIARAIHSLSNRSRRPLVKVNCAALPINLIESELFGHEKGAFTGALSKKKGRFELADGGTIFLDEIGDLPLELQVKLLRVLQEGEFERVGNPNTLKVDVRVIAATNRSLEDAIKKGVFREDLFYRLNVFPVLCPPLRERRSDIPLLMKFFVRKYSIKSDRKIDRISQKFMGLLNSYHWPGNIRELQNIIERAIVLGRGPKLQMGDWFVKTPLSKGKQRTLSLDELQKKHILYILGITNWRIRGNRGAAEILGVKPTTLEARMKKLDIQRN